VRDNTPDDLSITGSESLKNTASRNFLNSTGDRGSQCLECSNVGISTHTGRVGLQRRSLRKYVAAVMGCRKSKVSDEHEVAPYVPGTTGFDEHGYVRKTVL
jgi:hypothetical protein